MSDEIKLQNWKRDITYHAGAFVVAESVDDIVRIVKDRDRYPSPVRIKGSHHSTTDCIVAEGGTVIDITKMNKILNIDKENKTITMQPGVLHIDAARELEKHGLQFFVNCEIGNLTVGSGACTATKDASYFANGEQDWEFGQVNSYAIKFKAILPSGETLEVTEDDPELLAAMRSSYGMLGAVVEVTYRVKEIRPMTVEHIVYHIDEFADRLHELVDQKRSMMLYLMPHLDQVVVEYRYDGPGPLRSHTFPWRLRNWAWKTGSPFFGRVVSQFVPWQGLRGVLLNAQNRLVGLVMTKLIRGKNTSPADQIIHYPETAPYAAYTFSIWGFPRDEYPQTIRKYFQFCKDYLKDNGYRCDLLNVGYHIAQDESSLFSYTRKWPCVTIDPVATGSTGWKAFLKAYNEFCLENNGKPLLNQTPYMTPHQVQTAFSEEIEIFQQYRKQHDPEDRFYPQWFREMFESKPGQGG